MSDVLELAIDEGPTTGAYSVRVLRSVGGGQLADTFELNVDELVAALPSLESSVLASSLSARRALSDRESAIQTVGARLSRCD